MDIPRSLGQVFAVDIALRNGKKARRKGLSRFSFSSCVAVIAIDSLTNFACFDSFVITATEDIL